MKRCPACGSRSLSLQEYLEDIRYFLQEENGRTVCLGTLDGARPVKVEGCCLSCDHVWTIPGVQCIEDLCTPELPERDK